MKCAEPLTNVGKLLALSIAIEEGLNVAQHSVNHTSAESLAISKQWRDSDATNASLAVA